jgi:hypothetical protein
LRIDGHLHGSISRLLRGFRLECIHSLVQYATRNKVVRITINNEGTPIAL